MYHDNVLARWEWLSLYFISVELKPGKRSIWSTIRHKTCYWAKNLTRICKPWTNALATSCFCNLPPEHKAQYEASLFLPQYHFANLPRTNHCSGHTLAPSFTVWGSPCWESSPTTCLSVEFLLVIATFRASAMQPWSAKQIIMDWPHSFIISVLSAPKWSSLGPSKYVFMHCETACLCVKVCKHSTSCSLLFRQMFKEQRHRRSSPSRTEPGIKESAFYKRIRNNEN